MAVYLKESFDELMSCPAQSDRLGLAFVALFAQKIVSRRMVGFLISKFSNQKNESINSPPSSGLIEIRLLQNPFVDRSLHIFYRLLHTLYSYHGERHVWHILQRRHCRFLHTRREVPIRRRSLLHQTLHTMRRCQHSLGISKYSPDCFL